MNGATGFCSDGANSVRSVFSTFKAAKSSIDVLGNLALSENHSVGQVVLRCELGLGGFNLAKMIVTPSLRDWVQNGHTGGRLSYTRTIELNAASAIGIGWREVIYPSTKANTTATNETNTVNTMRGAAHRDQV